MVSDREKERTTFALILRPLPSFALHLILYSHENTSLLLTEVRGVWALPQWPVFPGPGRPNHARRSHRRTERGQEQSGNFLPPLWSTKRATPVADAAVIEDRLEMWRSNWRRGTNERRSERISQIIARTQSSVRTCVPFQRQTRSRSSVNQE